MGLNVTQVKIICGEIVNIFCYIRFSVEELVLLLTYLIVGHYLQYTHVVRTSDRPENERDYQYLG